MRKLHTGAEDPGSVTPAVSRLTSFHAEICQSWLGRYLRFCFVGATGIFVDMTVLWLLSAGTVPGCGLSLSKVVAAEAAVLNNFLWNDVWTFRGLGGRRDNWKGWLRRLAKFNLICVAGIGWSVLLLNGLTYGLGINMYLANAASIVVVSLWNFYLNMRFSWRQPS